MKLLSFFKALREEDHRRALYVSMIFIMLNILFFLLVSMEEPDPPLQEKIVPIALEDMEIPVEYIVTEEPGGGGSQGGPSPIDEQTINSAAHIQTQTQQSVTVPAGSEDGDQDGVNNQPQPDQSLGFNGGGGDGNGEGDGTGFGDGDGTGKGDGDGTNGYGTKDLNRKIVSPPDFNASSSEAGIVAIDIWVDENGNVVQTRYNAPKSTMGSQYHIDRATKAAKSMKYDKRPGSGRVYVGYQRFQFIVQ